MRPSPDNPLLGPICSLRVFGQTFMLVNDNKVAVDLLEKRSSIYCSRPTFTFGGEMYVTSMFHGFALHFR